MSILSRRELLVTAGAGAVAGSLVQSTVLAATTEQNFPSIDPLSLVDSECLGPLELLVKSGADVVVNAQSLAQARKPWMPSDPAPTPRYEELRIPGGRKAPDVRVILINSTPSAPPRPAILHMHGGGFVAGTAAEVVPSLQQVARENNCVIVTVDYRLAPETRFPGSLEDNYAALKWLHGSAGSLGVDPSRIAVMGESAGGGHAAMLAIAARDRGEVPIAFQLLIYPMLDDRTGSVRHVPPYIGAYIWPPDSNRFGWSSLLGVPAGSQSVPAGAVPARTERLAGLPPTFIGVGAIDLFVAEDMDYAKRLVASGVPTELCVVPGGYHGFDVIAPEASASKVFRATWNRALAKALGRGSMSDTTVS